MVQISSLMNLFDSLASSNVTHISLSSTEIEPIEAAAITREIKAGRTSSVFCTAIFVLLLEH